MSSQDKLWEIPAAIRIPMPTTMFLILISVISITLQIFIIESINLQDKEKT